MAKRRRVLWWLFWLAGSVMATTVSCIVVGVVLEILWGINTLDAFYMVVARMSVASMLLMGPWCIVGIYLLKQRRKAQGGKGR